MEKNIEEGLNHEKMQEIRMKYHSNHRKHKYKLYNKSRKQYNRICIEKEISNQSNYGL